MKERLNQARISIAQGELKKAEEIGREILLHWPGQPDALEMLGEIAWLNGRPEAALGFVREAVRQRPGFDRAYLAMGRALMALGRFDQAASAYQKVLTLSPPSVHALMCLSDAFLMQNQMEKAILCYREALKLDPRHFAAHRNLGNACKRLGLVAEARAAYGQALKIAPDPGLTVRRALCLPAINQSRESIAKVRNDLVQNLDLLTAQGIRLDDPLNQVRDTNFLLAYHGLNDLEIQKKIASFHLKAAPGLDCGPAPGQKKKEDGRIRLGIVSRGLHGHTIGKLNLGIIRNLSREKFEVIIFRVPEKKDRLANEIDRAADQVVGLPQQDLSACRKIIADYSLDILFYLDIGMDPLTYFLAFSRLAQVQCVTWGHPVTTGIPNVDYFISSSAAEPDNPQDHYSEKLVLLDTPGTYFYRPNPPERPFSRQEYGLPPRAHLYVCPQSLFKFHPDFDRPLAAILRQDPEGLIVLIEGHYNTWANQLRNRLAASFPRQVDRIRFLPNLSIESFLALLIEADAVLDTFHFSGGMSSLEALACGAPIVTRPGQYLRGRLTLAFYKKMDFMDLVAGDEDSYVNMALRLANDRVWRDSITEKIKKRAGILFEDMTVIRELEHFFYSAVRGNSV